jgi:hypothetical protein
MEEMRNSYIVLVGKAEGKGSLKTQALMGG